MYKKKEEKRSLGIYINREKYESRITQKNSFLLTNQKDYLLDMVRETKESGR
jgi:hypothetical protein